MPIEQLLRDNLFELLHLKANSGLRAEQTRRAAADTSSLGNRQEATQQIAVELRKLGIALNSYLVFILFVLSMEERAINCPSTGWWS